MNRYRTLETLQANTRDALPSAAVLWLAAVRIEMEKLTKAALSGEVSDEEFLALVEETSKGLPDLLDRMDHDALARLMEDSMGAAMANGMSARMNKHTAQSPWSVGGLLFGSRKKGRGKRCGNSWISPDKECRNESRKEQRRRPTRKQKIEAEKKPGKPNPERDAVIARYRRGVEVQSPAGRTVTFGQRVADHLKEKETERARFGDLAEKAVASPDEVWQDGMRCRYLKRPIPGHRNSILVVTQRTSETTEEVVTFMKQKPSEKNPPGRKIYPAD